MKLQRLITFIIIYLFLAANWVIAQDIDNTNTHESSAGHGPPPQAYIDCQGKKSGDTVQHTTPEGIVTAICQDSPEGLVARPNNRLSKQHNNPPQ